MKELTFKRVHWLNRGLFDAFMELYEASFPREERRSRRAQINVIGDPDYHGCALFDGDTFVGLACWWNAGTCLYLEHLAILPTFRGRGYGQKAIAHLRSQGYDLALDIEPPTDEATRRRLKFYERLNFVTNSHDHRFPPYHPGQEPFPMQLLTYRAPFTETHYQTLRNFLFRHTKCED